MKENVPVKCLCKDELNELLHLVKLMLEEAQLIFLGKKCQKYLEYDQFIFRIFQMDTGAENLPATVLKATI